MNVKKYRENLKISQKDIASKLKMTQQAYSRKERGIRKFTIDEAFKLEDILKVSIRELFEEDSQ